MAMLRAPSVLAAAALAAGGCVGAVPAPDRIYPAYVSPERYAALDCAGLQDELARVTAQAHALGGEQRQERLKDQAAFAASLVFWPAALIGIGPDREREIASVKGQHQALTTVAAEKGCR